MVGKAIISVIFAVALTTAPTLAQEAGEPGRAKETCAEISLDGDYELRIPCPPGIRPLLEKLPRPADPALRRDIVIDPEWAHDQAMVTEHDWPHDWAMIAPQAGEEEETVPLFDDLLGLLEPLLSGDSAEQSPGDWYFGLDEPYLSGNQEEDGGWGDAQFGEELDGTAE